jgi:hypothetical protein
MLGAQDLLARFDSDHRLEIAHHLRIGMGTGGGTDAVKRVLHRGDPIAQRFVHRVLQRLRPGFHHPHLGAEELHAKDVERLAVNIFLPHEDFAFLAEQRRHRRRSYAMLAGAGLGDDPCLPHPAREQTLTDRIVDLVRAGVTEVLALQVDLRAAEAPGQVLREVERRGPSGVFAQAVAELGFEVGSAPPFLVGCLELEQRRHQCLGDVAPAEFSEVTGAIRQLWHFR